MTPEQERNFNNLLHAYKASLLMDPANADKLFLTLADAYLQQAEGTAWDAARSVYLKRNRGDEPIEEEYYEVPVHETIEDWRESRKQEEGEK